MNVLHLLHFRTWVSHSPRAASLVHESSSRQQQAWYWRRAGMIRKASSMTGNTPYLILGLFNAQGGKGITSHLAVRSQICSLLPTNSELRRMGTRSVCCSLCTPSSVASHKRMFEYKFLFQQWKFCKVHHCKSELQPAGCIKQMVDRIVIQTPGSTLCAHLSQYTIYHIHLIPITERDPTEGSTQLKLCTHQDNDSQRCRPGDQDLQSSLFL